MKAIKASAVFSVVIIIINILTGSLEVMAQTNQLNDSMGKVQLSAKYREKNYASDISIKQGDVFEVVVATDLQGQMKLDIPNSLKYIDRGDHEVSIESDVLILNNYDHYKVHKLLFQAVGISDDVLQAYTYSDMKKNKILVSNALKISIRNDDSDGEEVALGNKVKNKLISKNKVEDFNIFPPKKHDPKEYYLVNGDFEHPTKTFIPNNSYRILPESEVEGWSTTASDHAIEIARGTGGEKHHFNPAHGEKFAEINANVPGELHQVVKTVPETTMQWSLFHAGRDQADTMSVNIGTSENHPSVRVITTGDRKWTEYKGEYKVPAGQHTTYFGFQAINSKDESHGNYIDNINFKLPDGVDAIKRVDKPKAKVGDTLTYTIEAWNSGVGDKKAALKDVLEKKYISYVPNTTEIDGVSQTDSNIWEGDELKINDINLKTGQHQIITFNVKVKDSAKYNIIENKATITDMATNTTKETPPVLTVIESPKMTLNKAVDLSKAKVGDALTYTIKAENTGNADWKGTIHDALPSDLVTYLDKTTKINGQNVSDKDIWKANEFRYNTTVKAKEKVTITFQVKVNEAARHQTVKNIADGGDPKDPDNPQPTPPVPTVIESPKMTLNKAVDLSKAKVGDALTYTIKAENTGNADWKGTIHDALPSDLVTYLDKTTKINGQNVSDKDIWKANEFRYNTTVKAKEKVTITFQVKVNEAARHQTVKNIADGGDPKDPDNPQPTPPVPTVIESPKMTLNKAVDLSKAKVGDALTYTIKAENTGNADWKGTIHDALPSDLVTYLDKTTKINGQNVSDKDIWKANEFRYNTTVKAKEKVTITFQVKVNEAARHQTVKNIADGGDPKDPDNPQPTPPVPTVIESPKMTLNKAVDLSKAKVGDALTYTIKAENTGNADWKGTIHDALPSDLVTYLDKTTKINGQNVSDKDIWKANEFRYNTTVKAKEKVTITFQVKVNEAARHQTVKNIADGGDPKDPDNPQPTPPVPTVIESPKMTLNKAVDLSKAKVGDALTYTIKAENTGNADWKGTIHDALPSDLVTYLDKTTKINGQNVSDKDIWKANEFRYNTTVKAKEKVTITFQVKVNEAARHQTVKNIADGGDPKDPDNPQPTPPVPTVIESPKMTLNKAVDLSKAKVGDALTYTIKAENTGNADWKGTIHDALPSDLVTYLDKTTKINGQNVSDKDIWKANEFRYNTTVKAKEKVTITFQVKVNEAARHQTVKNIADGGDPKDPDNPQPTPPVPTVIESPKMTLNKAVDLSKAKVGDALTYTIKAENTGNADWKGTIHDALPSDLVTYLDKTTKINGQNVSDKDIWKANEFRYNTTVKAKEKVTITFQVKVNEAARHQTVKNIADGGDPKDPDNPQPTPPVPTVIESPKMTLNKAVDLSKAKVGDALTYTIKAENTGNADWKGTIHDALPSDLVTYLDKTTKINGQNVSDKDIWKANEFRYNTTVKAKEKVTITFQVKVNEAARHQTVKNIADGGDPKDPDNPQPTPPVPTVIESPKMTLNKAVDLSKAKVGDALTYTIKAENTGNADWKGTIHDALPSDLVTYLDKTTKINGQNVSDKDIWKANEFRYNTTVKAKEKVAITFQVKVNEAARHQTVKNIADGGDPKDPDNPQPTPPVPTVIESPKMTLNKAVDLSKAKVGDALTYTIKAENTGNADWKGTIHDALPSDLVTYLDKTTKINGQNVSDKDIWKANEFRYNTTVKAKEKVTITFQVKVNEAARHQTVKNIADGGDPKDPDNPQPTPPVPTVIESPKMTLNKAVDLSKAKVGDALTYTIKAENTGNADWKGTIHDALPSDLVTYLDKTTKINGQNVSDKDIWKANEFRYNTTVKAKEKVAITFQVKVNEAARHQTVKNIADGGDPKDPDNPQPTPPVPTVIESPKMTLNKAVDLSKAKVGDALTYTIKAENTGNADWKGTIHDALPSDLVTYLDKTTKINGQNVSDKDIWKANEFRYNTTVKAKEKVTITFQVKVNEAARHQTVKNIADGGDPKDPDNPQPTPPVPTVIESPKMTLNKAVDLSKAKVGDALTYTIKAENTGNADWKGTIHDALPSDLVTYLDKTTKINGQNVSDKDIWKANEFRYNTTVKAKEKVTITFQVKVNEAARHQTVKNIADGGDPKDPDNPQPTPPVPTVIESPKMTLNKAVDLSKAKVGDALTYTIKAENTGNADWKGTIHDALPSDLVTYLDKTTKINGQNVSDKDIWKANEFRYNTTVKAKEKVTITFQVKVNEAARHQTVKNIADGGDPKDPDNPQPTPPVPTVIESPKMTLNKAVDLSKAKVGDALTYTIKAENTGNADWKGTIHDALPSDLVTYLDKTTKINGQNVSDKDIWKANEFRYNTTVKAKEKVTITFQVKVNEAARHQTVKNIADGGDPKDPDNPQPTPPVPTVIESPKMTLNKAVDLSKAKVGDALTYTIKAENTGNADWKGTIHDALPSDLVTYLDKTTKINGQNVSDKDIWKANEFRYNTTVKAKEKVTITFQVKVNEAARHQTVKNIADGGDPKDPDNPQPTPPVPTVIESPKMTLNKAVDLSKAKVGDALTYTIKAENTGNADWKGTIHDALPSDLVTYLDKTTKINGQNVSDKDIWKANEFRYNTTVKAKEKVTITFQVKVNEAARHQTVKNIADGGDPKDPDNPQPTPPVPTVIESPKMTLNKAVDLSKAKVGDALTYTIKAENTGNADWKGTIHDALPSDLVTYLDKTTKINGQNVSDKDIWKANEFRYNTTVKAKEKVTITFQVKVNEAARHQTVKNIADGGDPKDPDNPQPTPPVPTVIESPKMTLNKAVDLSKAKVGDALTYTIKAENTGNADWKGTIHDALPSDLVTYLDKTTKINGQNVSDKDIWKANEFRYNTTVKAKEKVTITFQVKVNEAARHQTVKNIADGGDPKDPDNPQPTPPVPTVIESPKMTLNKAVDLSKAKVGDALTYTIKAENTGNADWKGTIHDALPSDLVTYLDKTTKINGQNVSDKDIWKANEFRYNTTVKAKEKVTITFQVKVNEAARHQTVKNIADGGDPKDPDNPQPTPPVPTVIESPKMTLNKAVDLSKAKVGDALTYTIKAENTGNADWKGTIHDALPSDLVTYLDKTTKINGQNVSDKDIWKANEFRYNTTVKAKEKVAITFQVKVNEAARHQTVKNIADGGDPKDPDNPQPTPPVPTVIESPKMTLNKAVDLSKAKVGDALTYTIKAENTGNADWKGTIHDALPSDLVTYLDKTTKINGQNVSDKDIWKANEFRYNTTVKAKEKVTITFQVKVNEAARHQTVKNIADGGDPKDPDNPQPTPPVPTVIESPKMTLNKAVDLSKAKVGDALTYTIKAENTGNADWKGTIHDALPSDLVTYLDKTTKINGQNVSDKDIWKANEFRYNTTVKAKEKVAITFQVKVNEAARHQTVKNIADGGDPKDPDNPQPTPPVPTVIESPKMTLNKAVDLSKAKVGDALTYTIKAENTGNADWKGTIHDALPSDLVTYLDKTTKINGQNVSDKDIWKANEFRYNTTVKAKEKVTITFQVKVNEAARHQTVKNIADGGDPKDPDNPQPTPPVPTVIESPKMTLNKAVDLSKAKVGDALTYTIKAENTGNADWKGTIHDALPSDLVTYLDKTTKINGQNVSDKDIWKANEFRYNTTVKAKEKVTITFQVKVNEAARHQTVKNIADGGDPKDPDNPQPTPPVPTVIESPKMTLNKAVDLSKAKVGDALTYTIKAENTGNADWKGTIHDALPSDLVTYLDKTTKINGQNVSDKDIWKANEFRYNTTVKAKEKVTITFQVKVNEAARHQTVKNIADGGDPKDPDNPQPTPPVPTVIESPKMTLNKAVDLSKAKVGDALTYTIKAENTGNADWKGTIHDALPSDLVTYLDKTTKINGQNVSDKDIWKANEFRYNTTVKAKEKVTITFQVKVNEAARHQTVKNIADGGDPKDPDNPQPTPPVPTVIESPKMTLNKAVDLSKAKVGDALTYTIKAENTGNADWKGTIHDALPSDLVTYLDKTTKINGQNVSDKDIWKANEFRYNTTVKAKEKVTITFQVKVNEAARHQTVKNIADGGDPKDPDNPQPTPPVPTVIESPKMTLNKAVDLSKAKVGDALTYTIKAENTGNADWKGTIHDALPSDLVTYLDKTTKINGQNVSDKDIWKANEFRYNTTVKAKEKVTITFQVKVNEAARHQTVKNIADGGDPKDPDNPQPTPPVPTVIESPKMTLNKAVDLSKAKVGDALTYTIKAENTGNADWKGTIHDALPSDLVTYLDKTTKINGQNVSDKDIWKANEFRYNTTVKAKEKVTITFQVKVNEAARHQTVKNIADGGDPKDPDNPQPTPPVPTVIESPKMTLNKAVDLSKAKVGDALTYTIKAENTGNADWKGTIHDALPSDLVTYLDKTTKINGQNVSDKDIWKANEFRYNTTVKAKEKVTITFQVKVNEAARHQTVKNIADGGDPKDPDNPQPTPPVPTVIESPKMTLNKAVDLSKAKVGDALTYTIKAENTGNADWKGTIHDALPSDLVTYLDKTTKINGQNVSDKDIWKANEFRYNTTVKAKEKVAITFQVKVNEAARHQTVKNIADGGDPKDPDNPQPTPPVPTVIESPKMTLNKAVDLSKAKVGDALTYTIKAENTGNADWKGTIHDALPSDLVTYLDKTTKINGQNVSDKDIWKANEFRYNTTVKAKEKVAITFQVKVNEAARHQTVKNIADGGDPKDPDNPQPTPPVPTVIESPKMTLNKAVDLSKAKVGDALTYTIKAENTGNADWKGTIHDALPSDLVTYLDKTTKINGQNVSDKDIWKANEFRYNTTVKAKEKVTITFQVKVNEVARHQTVKNIADGGDPKDPDNPQPTPPVPTVIESPKMTLNKAVDLSKAKVGDALTYTIKAENTGNADWKGTIHDALPSDLVTYLDKTTKINGQNVSDKDIWKANEFRYNTTVKAKEKVTITFQVKVNEAARHQTVKNIADGGDPKDPDNPQPTPPVPTVIESSKERNLPSSGERLDDKVTIVGVILIIMCFHIACCKRKEDGI